MKKIICFIFLGLACAGSEVRSQSYIPMLTDSAYWDLAYSVVGMVCNEFGPNGAGPYRYRIDGDTLVNGTAYKKFRHYEFHRVSQNPGPNCPPFYLDTVGFPGGDLMREDTVAQKIYVYNQGTQQEELWYDFDVQVGDSVDYGIGWPTSGPFSVDTIYFITTPDGLSRKVIQCNDAAISLCGFYVEGIGGISGPFLPPYYVFEEGWWLMCAGIYNQSLLSPVGNFSYYCGALTSSLNEYSSNFLNISPNPAVEFIDVTSGIYPVDVTISDMYGKKLKTYHLESSQSIDISDLSAAVYLVSIMDAGSHLTTKKIIKL